METSRGGQYPGQSRTAAEQARNAAEQAKQRMNQRLGEQKGSVARELHEFSQALRSAADHYQGREHGETIGSYVRQAADGVDHLRDTIERKSLSDMLNDFQRLCRERPLVVGAGALIAGFVGARIARGATAATRNAPESHGEELAHEPDPRDVMRSEGGI